MAPTARRYWRDGWPIATRRWAWPRSSPCGGCSRSLSRCTSTAPRTRAGPGSRLPTRCRSPGNRCTKSTRAGAGRRTRRADGVRDLHWPRAAGDHLARDEAIGLGDDFVGTEHLLTGLAGVPQAVAGELLTEHGLSASVARAEVARSRASETSPAGQPEPGIAPVDALAAIGIDVAAIRERAEAFGRGEVVYPRPAYDDAAKAAIEQSVAQALVAARTQAIRE